MRKFVLACLGVTALGLGPLAAAPADPSSVPDLVKGLADENKAVRLKSARELGDLGAAARTAAPALYAALKEDREPEVRSQCGKALAQIGPHALPFLLQGLDDKDRVVRSWSVRAVGLIGPEAKEAVGPLTKALKDSQAGIRGGAAQALGEIGPAAEASAPALIEALADSDKDVRARAAAALARIGPDTAARLEAALKDDRPAVRHGAARVLASFGPEAADAVPALGQALKDKDAKVRFFAAAALGEIGPKAEPAVPLLIEALKDKDQDVQAQAAGSLALVGPSATPALARALSDPEAVAIRPTLLYVLGQLGPDARAAVPALTDLLKDKDPNVVRLAVLALGTLGPEAKGAVPTLKELLESKSTDVRLGAALALVRIEPQNKDAPERLNKEITQVPFVAKPSAATLAQLDVRRQAENQRFIDFFVYATSFRFGDGLKRESHQALTRLGPDAIPVLTRTLNRMYVDNTGKVPIPDVKPVGPGAAAVKQRTFYFV